MCGFADNFEMVDMNRLDDLERMMTEAEELVISSNLEKRYDEIIDTRDRQKSSLTSYSTNLNELRLDVENIQDIREKLPVGCFKQLDLEKTEP